jgi:hypothetical protein
MSMQFLKMAIAVVLEVICHHMAAKTNLSAIMKTLPLASQVT